MKEPKSKPPFSIAVRIGGPAAAAVLAHSKSGKCTPRAIVEEVLLQMLAGQQPAARSERRRPSKRKTDPTPRREAATTLPEPCAK